MVEEVEVATVVEEVEVVEEVSVATEVVLRCMMPLVLTAAIDARYRLSLPAKNQSFAATVSKVADVHNPDQGEMIQGLVLMSSQR